MDKTVRNKRIKKLPYNEIIYKNKKKTLTDHQPRKQKAITGYMNQTDTEDNIMISNQ